MQFHNDLDIHAHLANMLGISTYAEIHNNLVDSFSCHKAFKTVQIQSWAMIYSICLMPYVYPK